jgi:hypothetical protein
VYRAHDPRVGRDVAIKVSQERFTERFDREARAVAALNHPNICTLYDVGPNYLVMEFVEGEAPKGPLPFETALNYAHQIADALEAAHEKNIVHRDLKPANIKIRPDGAIKVLDFGLAKLPPGSAGDPENSPTLSMAATQAGMILGTAGYMSPEQARGKLVDRRADIWAFGVVFHEMLTGRRVFAGEDATSTLAKVIEAEPSWQGVPTKVQRLLKKCLEKDPKKRLRDIGDAWELLEEEVHDSRAREGGGRWLWPSIAAVLAFIAATSAFLGRNQTRLYFQGSDLHPPAGSEQSFRTRRHERRGHRVLFPGRPLAGIPLHWENQQDLGGRRGSRSIDGPAESGWSELGRKRHRGRRRVKPENGSTSVRGRRGGPLDGDGRRRIFPSLSATATGR